MDGKKGYISWLSRAELHNFCMILVPHAKISNGALILDLFEPYAWALFS